MSDGARKVVIGSMIVAGIVAVASVLDLVSGFPFESRMWLDIMFILSAAIIGYLGYDALTEMR